MSSINFHGRCAFFPMIAFVLAACALPSERAMRRAQELHDQIRPGMTWLEAASILEANPHWDFVAFSASSGTCELAHQADSLLSPRIADLARRCPGVFVNIGLGASTAAFQIELDASGRVKSISEVRKIT